MTEKHECHPTDRDREMAREIVSDVGHSTYEQADGCVERAAQALAQAREEESAWWTSMLAEAERRLRETPGCGYSLVEDAWPFIDLVAQLQGERVRAACGEGGSDAVDQAAPE